MRRCYRICANNSAILPRSFAPGAAQAVQLALPGGANQWLDLKQSPPGLLLVTALCEGGRPACALGAPGSDSRWFRVRVTDLRSGRNKVNVNIPMGLVNVGLKMGARFAPNMEGVNLEEMMTAIKSGASGKIMDVTDEDSGEHVEIYVE